MRSLIFTAVVLGAVIGTPVLMAFGWTTFGAFAGANFQLLDPWEQYLVGVIAAGLGFVGIVFWPVSPSERGALFLLWGVRVGVTLGAMLGYEAFYSSLDAMGYFRRALSLEDPLALIVFGAGTDNVTALTGLLTEFTTSYHALKVIFSYLGLIAVFLFYRAVTVAIGRPMLSILYVLGVFPSILFWSSILGKDPVVLLGIAIYALGVVYFFAGRRALAWPLILLGIAIAAYIRVWLGTIFLSSFIGAVVLAGSFKFVTKIGFGMLSVPIFVIALRKAAERFNIESASDVVMKADTISKSWSHGGSAQAMIEIGSFRDMVEFMPFGIFTALFRPLPGEVMNPFGLMAGMQNAVLLILLVTGILRSGWRWIREPVLMWLVLTLLAWSSIYGFASYQNLGTAFRFKVQVEPFLVSLVMLLNFWPALAAERAAEQRAREGMPQPAR